MCQDESSLQAVWMVITNAECDATVADEAVESGELSDREGAGTCAEAVHGGGRKAAGDKEKVKREQTAERPSMIEAF